MYTYIHIMYVYVCTSPCMYVSVRTARPSARNTHTHTQTHSWQAQHRKDTHTHTHTQHTHTHCMQKNSKRAPHRMVAICPARRNSPLLQARPVHPPSTAFATAAHVVTPHCAKYHISRKKKRAKKKTSFSPLDDSSFPFSMHACINTCIVYVHCVTHISYVN
jgi:hypothetical protein